MGLKEDIEKRREADRLAAEEQIRKEAAEKKEREEQDKRDQEQSLQLRRRVVDSLAGELAGAYEKATIREGSVDKLSNGVSLVVAIPSLGSIEYQVRITVSINLISLECLRSDRSKYNDQTIFDSNSLQLKDKSDEVIGKWVEKHLGSAAQIIDSQLQRRSPR